MLCVSDSGLQSNKHNSYLYINIVFKIYIISKGFKKVFNKFLFNFFIILCRFTLTIF